MKDKKPLNQWRLWNHDDGVNTILNRPLLESIPDAHQSVLVEVVYVDSMTTEDEKTYIKNSSGQWKRLTPDVIIYINDTKPSKQEKRNITEDEEDVWKKYKELLEPKKLPTVPKRPIEPFYPPYCPPYIPTYPNDPLRPMCDLPITITYNN